ncbi:MAG: hypothetical protein PHU34_02795 [Candidatus Methanoperedens sp.]|nr:hypothetical protein [Candidatus Methanoperedens sp.]
MINTLENDDEHLVHLCFCDEAPNILDDEFIKGKKYLSFSRGMPLGITHGDTAIIFNRSKLESKGYNFTNIEYTREFLDKNPLLKEHICAGDFDINNIRKYLKKRIKELKKLKAGIEKIKYCRKQLKSYEQKDIVPLILNACSREKESVLCDTCMDFEMEDIDAIICSSRTVHKYYPLPERYISKITYIHDYFPAKYAMFSPLQEYWEDLETYYNTVTAGAPIIDAYIHQMYHYTYQLALNIDASMMASIEPKPVMELSTLFEKAFMVLPKLDKSTKIDFSDKLLNKRILYGNESPELEKYIRTETDKILSEDLV